MKTVTSPTHSPSQESPLARIAARLPSKPYIPLLAILVVGLLCYANTFHVPFHLDDEENIVENPVIRSLGNFLANGSGYENFPNRFIAIFTFALNYYFGGLNVAGYHVVNLAIHVINALLVYGLVTLTLRTPFFRERPGAHDQTIRLLPLCAALLFVCHPMQTQAVTYIYQRVASLTTLFYLAALLLHIRWRMAQAEGAPFRSRRVAPFYLLSLLAAVLAMKTKEIAFTLPLAVLLYEFCFFGRPGRRLLLLLAPMFMTMLIIPATMIDFGALTGAPGSVINDATSFKWPFSRWAYLCTQFSVIVTYLRLFLLPVNQNLDHDYPISHSLLEPRAFLSLALLFALLALAGWLYRQDKKEGAAGESAALSRLMAFGILWFFITLAVESSLIPILDVIFEHRVYLPSAGLFVAVAALLFAGAERLRSRLPHAGGALLVVLAVAVATLSVATFRRNIVWQDAERLWSDVKAKSPRKARAYNMIATIRVRQNRHAESLGELLNAISLKPDYADAYYNLGIVYKELGMVQESTAMYHRATTLNSSNADAFNNMGGNYIHLGSPERAVEAFSIAVRLRPGRIDFRNNLALALLLQGYADEAVRELQTVLQLRPGDPKATRMLQEIERLQAAQP
ncbi:tetratricopeptide repeat protein [Geobacter sp. FeAm09]|uniref:tetratricopeptide repeat protein n=1 Tax=Geobacter sp. FeAm09 TaxID=2597769 RepID=UPI0011EFF8CB|nr:tetratricopeptide repeat protein [Geobacter sp. FeAm09]QEM66784.1 tetratricopeptide repeat protein [Geobacter sp. FeAm09]